MTGLELLHPQMTHHLQGPERAFLIVATHVGMLLHFSSHGQAQGMVGRSSVSVPMPKQCRSERNRRDGCVSETTVRQAHQANARLGRRSTDQRQFSRYTHDTLTTARSAERRGASGAFDLGISRFYHVFSSHTGFRALLVHATTGQQGGPEDAGNGHVPSRLAQTRSEQEKTIRTR